MFKDVAISNIRLYVNPKSEVYIPQLLYEETKHLPKQIFERISPQQVQALMAKRTGLNFVNEAIDLMMNVGEAYGVEFHMNLVCGHIKLNVSEPVVRTFLTFKQYLENYLIIRTLKKYRPQRKPLVASEMPAQFRVPGARLPESLKRKKRMLVRDWFQYAVWFVRLRNVVRRKPSSMTKAAKSTLEQDPERYKDLVKAASDGMGAMREYLQKEEKQRRLEQQERNEMRDMFPFKSYTKVHMNARIDSVHVQIFEKPL